MTHQKLLPILFIFSLLLFTGCGKDDDSSDPKPATADKTNLVAGEKGTNFEIGKNGEAESCVGEYFFGWAGGQLLNSSRYKQIRIGCDGNPFALRISMPQGTAFLDIVEGIHNLNQYKLLLQDTSTLDQVHVEFYQNLVEPVIVGNATGTVELKRDVVVNDTTYAIVGIVDASFYNNGSRVDVKGQFWSQTVEW